MDTLRIRVFGARAKGFFLTNIVFFIAMTVAIITCFFVPPDKEYVGYFDFKTLTCLFCMLAVICGLRNIHFFRICARKITRLFKNTRSAIIALVFITYFASMLIANDMALITFLPLGLIVLNTTRKQKYMAFTFIMQNIAANLGGMLTPFGNPQNLYLYNFFDIANADFFKIMLPPFLIAVALILLCCLFVKKEKFETEITVYEKKLNLIKTIIYFLLFTYSILIVFRTVPFWTGFLMIPIIFFLDKKALLQVDYMLLLTFCMFFIFSGNLARIDAVKQFLSYLMEKSTLLTGIISCQLISNVPSAVLLSNFTNNYQALLIAVNIGGCGTLISSLASLITFKQFIKERPKEVGKYLLLFHLLNFGFLLILTLSCWFII